MKNHFGCTGYWLNFWVMVSCSTAMLLFGYDQGVFGGILTLEIFSNHFGLNGEQAKNYHYDIATRQGIIVGSYDLGCFAGAVIMILIGGYLGRKKSIFFGTCIMVIGACLQSASNDYGTMVSGRVVAGIGNGMNTVTAPVWATECSKLKRRGQNGIILMVVNILGLALSCWLTFGFSYIYKSAASWRFPLAFQIVFGLVILSTVPWLPESPRWLMMKKREDEALTIMVALEGNGITDQGSAIRTEFDLIKQTLALERGENEKGEKIDTTQQQLMPTFRVVLGVGCQVMQQLTGINIICYYLPVVLNKSVGLTGEISRLLSGVNATTYFLATLIGLIFVDRWGRRRLMMYGALGQCFCWMAIAILLGCGKLATLARSTGVDDSTQIQRNAPRPSLIDAESPMERRLAEASVAFFFIFNIFFGAGWQGVSWLYPTEINTTQKRIIGMALGVGMNWLINFGVVFVTPKGIESLGYKYYILWTIFNLASVPIIYLFYPETSHRSLEQIDQMFEIHPTIWVYKHKSMTRVTPLPPADEERSEGQEKDEGPERTERHEGAETPPAPESTMIFPGGVYEDVAGQDVQVENLEPEFNASNVGEGELAGPNIRSHSGDTFEGTALEGAVTLASEPTAGHVQHVVSVASGF